jgi:hypothetical protein
LVPFLGTTEVIAQKQTERYIPIGKSPGLSGKYTIIAAVDVMDMREGTLTCTDTAGTVTVKIDEKTRIWVDRSAQGLTALDGAPGDCRKGQIVEIKFRNNERRIGAVAEWIKVKGQ